MDGSSLEDFIFYAVYTMYIGKCDDIPYLSDPVSFHTHKERAIKEYNKTQNLEGYRCRKCNRFHPGVGICSQCGDLVQEFIRVISPLGYNHKLCEYNSGSYDLYTPTRMGFSAMPTSKGLNGEIRKRFLSCMKLYSTTLYSQWGYYIQSRSGLSGGMKKKQTYVGLHMFSLRFNFIIPEISMLSELSQSFHYRTYIFGDMNGFKKVKYSEPQIMVWDKSYFLQEKKDCYGSLGTYIAIQKIQRYWRKSLCFLRWKTAIKRVNNEILFSPHIPGGEYKKIQTNLLRSS